MSRVVVLIGATVCALILLVPAAAQAANRAGVASVDATWHVGASAGQFTADTGPVTEEQTVDPHLHTTKKRISDGVGLRTTTRALVVADDEGDRVAIVSHDLYLAQDFLTRRVAGVIAAHDRTAPPERRTGITAQTLAITASHNHNTPYYSTPGWGTAIFQDVYDLRFYDYMARRMAQAVIEASARMVPVRMGGTTRTFDAIQSHTYGPKVGDDGTPAGQPWGHTTRQLTVVRFDDISRPRKPRRLAQWVVLGIHPEYTWGYDLVNGDITHAAARMVDRELGTISVFSQRETGTSGPHKDARVHPVSARREFQDNGFGQLDRAARLLADAIARALEDIEQGTPEDPDAFAAYSSDFDVSAVSQRFAPPATRPFPGVSNCNTASLFHGDPRIPILGLPDCAKANEYGVQPVSDLYKPVTAPMWDQLTEAGVPVPVSYSGTALTAVEETAAVHLMAIKLGGIGATICPCEQFTDTALNIQSRLDRVAGNLWTGFDWAQQKTPAGRDWCVPSGAGDARTWTCANPSQPAQDLAPIADVAYRRFRAQIHNDAKGWETDLATLGSEAEPADPAQIKGNFTHEEHAAHGYDLAIAVGMGNDYWGYVPEYREYRSHDHYRKALSGLGPHGADFLATRLSRMAASLNGAPAVALSPLDTAFAAESARAQVLADGLGAVARAYVKAYESAQPADAGVPEIVAQPPSIERFGAAHVSWIGGSNWSDLPDVVVERRVDGDWVEYGDMSGDVQLTLRFPKADQLPQVAGSTFAWKWTAAFEAFSSDVAQPDARGRQRASTPAGTYRFVVRGHHRRVGGRPAVPYTLRSEPFTVGRFTGLKVEDLRIDPDGRASMSGSVDYPDSYESPFRFIDAERNRVGDEEYCRRCSFRPWLDRGTVAAARATVIAADGRERTLRMRRAEDGRWRTEAPVPAGARVRVGAGDVSDAFGNTSGAPSEAVGR